MALSTLSGRRILVLEDEMLIALSIESALVDQGADVVGPFPRVAEALAAVETTPIDFALLDLNVAGEFSYPVAKLLSQRKVPFMFLTAYGQKVVPSGHPEWQWHAKPFKDAELVDRVRTELVKSKKDDRFAG